MYVCIFYLFIVVGIVHENKEHRLYYYVLAYPAPQRLIYHCLTPSWNSHFPWKYNEKERKIIKIKIKIKIGLKI